MAKDSGSHQPDRRQVLLGLLAPLLFRAGAGDPGAGEPCAPLGQGHSCGPPAVPPRALAWGGPPCSRQGPHPQPFHLALWRGEDLSTYSFTHSSPVPPRALAWGGPWLASLVIACGWFHLALWRGEDHLPETVSGFFSDAFWRLEKEEGPVDWSKKKPREKAIEDGLRVVAAYLDSPECLSEPPRAVEVFLHEEIDGLSVPLTGAMDLVRQDLVPVDFKSAAAKPDPELAAFDHELQLVSYQLMLEKATGDTPPALELIHLVKTKVPQVIRTRVPSADIQRKERVIQLLETAVQGITHGRFHPQPGMHCSWCPYRKECSEWGLPS